MTIQVEDGSIVANANSYVRVDEFVAYAGDRGWEIPTDPLQLESLLFNAMDYLEVLKYYGQKVNQETQPLQWPRTGVYIAGYELPTQPIPKNIRFAQMHLANAARTMDLLPSQSATAKGRIQTESVYGAVTRTYFKKDGPALMPFLGGAKALLEGYVISMPGFGGFNTIAMRR